MRLKLITVLVGCVVALVGCTSKEEAPAAPKAAEPAPAPEPAAAPEAKPASDPVAEAASIYTTRCTVCHGAGGKGDGAGSAALQPKPRDFTSAEWQASVTDEHITKIIQYGGASVGMAPIMPANPDLVDKPEVVAELVKTVRGFGAE
jgi:mono/diheme cytochrome c family protein